MTSCVEENHAPHSPLVTCNNESNPIENSNDRDVIYGLGPG